VTLHPQLFAERGTTGRDNGAAVTVFDEHHQ
jgi:hypothetical protein